jgi:hypothetical protein
MKVGAHANAIIIFEYFEKKYELYSIIDLFN